jgi:CcmD family protein
MRRIFTALALALALAAPVSLPAQSAPAVPTQAAARVTQAPTEPSGLPLNAPPPTTLRAYWHVFAAFAIAWLLLFGYTLVLGRRFATLDREIRQLRAEGPPA